MKPAYSSLSRLSRNERSRILETLRKRLPDRHAAEDVLQDALLKSLRPESATEPDKPAAWLNRVLKNEVVDFYRERAARGRRETRYAVESVADGPEDGSPDTPCACTGNLLPGLKREYATALKSVDRDGRKQTDVAREEGITINAMAVRLHRARAALKKRVLATCGDCASRGCGNCDCGATDR